MTKNISTIIEPHPFTIDDYQRMVDTGILEEDSKVELLAGQIVKMSPIGRFHAACIIRLNKILVIGLGDDYMVSVKSSIILDDQSQPEPDFAILKPKADAYQSGLPYPPETVVVIEVADSSIQKDKNVKAPLYARAGIKEFWIVDIHDEAILVYQQPEEGVYTEIQSYKGEEQLETHLPLTISAVDILG